MKGKKENKGCCGSSDGSFPKTSIAEESRENGMALKAETENTAEETKKKLPSVSQVSHVFLHLLGLYAVGWCMEQGHHSPGEDGHHFVVGEVGNAVGIEEGT